MLEPATVAAQCVVKKGEPKTLCCSKEHNIPEDATGFKRRKMKKRLPPCPRTCFYAHRQYRKELHLKGQCCLDWPHCYGECMYDDLNSFVPCCRLGSLRSYLSRTCRRKFSWKTKHCPQCGLTWDRDVNASINIGRKFILLCASIWPVTSSVGLDHHPHLL
mmetsp:Transcript_56237/g.138127  ORF Transcript_56237/g.138127 Transcript_56237/m.138127 type:complete len:161 (+) Transcript_56237:675-1157(+)